MSLGFVSPADIADTELCLAWLGDGNTLVRTRGRDAKQLYDRTHTPVHCECGCKIYRGLIHKHTKRKKHARSMAEKAAPLIAHDDDVCMVYDDDDDDVCMMMMYGDNNDDDVCMLALNPS